MNVDFIQAINLYFTEGFKFKGRSTRAEFWYAQLFLFIVAFIFALFRNPIVSTVSMIFNLICIVPTMALITRRFHDSGRSGWWTVGYYVISIVISIWAFISMGHDLIIFMTTPESLSIDQIMQIIRSMVLPGLCVFVLMIVYLIFMCQPSGPDNVYGPDPYKNLSPGADN